MHINQHLDNGKGEPMQGNDGAGWSVSFFENVEDAHQSGLFVVSEDGHKIFTGEGSVECEFQFVPHGVAAPQRGKRYSFTLYHNKVTEGAAVARASGAYFTYDPTEKAAIRAHASKLGFKACRWGRHIIAPQ